MRKTAIKRSFVLGCAVVAALVPAFVFERLVEVFLFNRAEAVAEQQARQILAQAEAPIRRAIAALDTLAAAGATACSPAATRAMQQVVFSTTALKEAGLVDENGALLCSQQGFGADHRALTAEHATRFDRVTVSVVQFGMVPERALRLRFVQGPPHLTAAIPVEVFMPDGFEGLEHGVGVRVVLADVPFAANMPTDVGPRDVHVVVKSADVPLTVEYVHSLSALKQTWASLVLMARLGGLLITAITLAISWSLDARRRREPIWQIERALEDGEFIPYYQPIVDLADGTLLGCEVLVRWKKPDGTIVSPGAFIRHLEQSSLILDLTVALMRAARDDLSPLFGPRPNLFMSFNLHADHFTGNRIVDDIESVFVGSSLRMSQIMLELTERAPLADLDAARRCIEALQARGARVAIDDVGTGHGGLSYLLKLGVDVIKIDKMFIDAIGTERYSVAIIETLVELGREMQMDVIAEGVETDEQVHALRDKAIRAGQGYVFAPPLPGTAFVQLVEAMLPPKVEAAAPEDEVVVRRRPYLRYAAHRGRRYAG